MRDTTPVYVKKISHLYGNCGGSNLHSTRRNLYSARLPSPLPQSRCTTRTTSTKGSNMCRVAFEMQRRGDGLGNTLSGDEAEVVTCTTELDTMREAVSGLRSTDSCMCLVLVCLVYFFSGLNVNHHSLSLSHKKEMSVRLKGGNIQKVCSVVPRPECHIHNDSVSETGFTMNASLTPALVCKEENPSDVSKTEFTFHSKGAPTDKVEKDDRNKSFTHSGLFELEVGSQKCRDSGKKGIVCDGSGDSTFDVYFSNDMKHMAIKGEGGWCADEKERLVCNRKKIGRWERFLIEGGL